jgi:hypothetical protein
VIILKKNDTTQVSGGAMIYDSVKLMISQARGQPGFDITVAALALINVAPQDFWSLDVAYHYVRTGNMTFPVTFQLNNYLGLPFFHTCFIL